MTGWSWGVAHAVWLASGCAPRPTAPPASEPELELREAQHGATCAPSQGQCQRKDWGSPVRVSEHHEHAFAPQLAVAASGAAIAVWEQDGIFARLYDPATDAWRSEQELDLPSGGELLEPHVAISDQGQGLAVWRQQAHGTSVVVASAYDHQALKWRSPTAISADGEQWEPRVVVDAHGNAVAVWMSGGPATSIRARRFSSRDVQWAPVVEVSTTEQVISSLEISVGANGDVIAVWEQGVVAQSIIMASRYVDATQRWSVPERLDAAVDAPAATGPQVVSLESGDTLAAWEDGSGSRHRLVMARHKGEREQWTEPQTIAAEPGRPRALAIAAACSGNSIAVWRQDGDDNSRILASHYDAATHTWTQPRVLGTAVEVERESSPQVAIDGCGNATVIWNTSDALEARHYDAAANEWARSSEPSTQGVVVGATEPHLGLDAQGHVFAVWQQRSSVPFEICANRSG